MGRQGASAEANNLEHALIESGCEVIKMEWSTTEELQNIAVGEIVTTCSLLIFSLMAHGSRGTVNGSTGESVPVNDILHQLSHTLPAELPMVNQLRTPAVNNVRPYDQSVYFARIKVIYKLI